ncbi:MAG: DNA-processing protein DprA [Microbacteriaceae bacterium]
MTMTELETIHQQHPTRSLDAVARVILSSVLEPGDTDAGKLVAAHGAVDTVRAIFADDGRAVATLRNRARPRFSIDGIAHALRTAERCGVTLVTPEHQHWPARVNDLGEHAPVALWVRGNSEILIDTITTSIVGARAATGYGEHITMEMAAGLVDRGHTIASGAAYGIDGMAHRAALASRGRTIAYLAGGVDRYYPSGHDALLTRIAEAGAVVSELPCGAAPTRWRFLQRNRLIAANSRAVVVTEAGWRSGALNSAGHARTLGRPVGAVPGPVTSAASAGTHRLIRDHGAVLVTNAEEAAEL